VSGIESGQVEAFEQAGLAGVDRPQFGQPVPERRGLAVAFGDVAQVDEELDGRVVLAWLLRGDEVVHSSPCGGLVDREGVEVPLPGGGRGTFPPGPVLRALFGVAAVPLGAEVRGGGEEVSGGAWGAREGSAGGVFVAVPVQQPAAQVAVAGDQVGEDGVLVPGR
jgi:hypothetical protein